MVAFWSTYYQRALRTLLSLYLSGSHSKRFLRKLADTGLCCLRCNGMVGPVLIQSPR